MRQHLRLLGIIAMVSVLAACSKETPVGPEPQSQRSSNLASTTIPADAVVDSVWLQLYPASAANPFSLHLVTADWDESSVTWNSLGDSFIDSPTASGAIADTGWVSVDVTDVVNAWLNGGSANYGLVIRSLPDSTANSVCFASREQGELGPHLVLYLTLPDSSQTVETLAATADATVDQAWPDSNFGAASTLCAGSDNVDGPFMRGLLRFELEVEEPEEPDQGCTRSKGYWKNHAGLGPQEDVVSQWLPISLGSLTVSTPDTAVLVLKQFTFGRPSNGITKLYAQLLAAKLNIASGALSDDVDDVISSADTFLSDHVWTDWDSLSKGDRKHVLSWMGTLDAYNNGLIGPGACEDECDSGYYDDGCACGEHDYGDGD